MDATTRPPPDEDDRHIRDRAYHAVDRSRNLRQLIVLQRLLRQLAAERRREGGGPTSQSH